MRRGTLVVSSSRSVVKKKALSKNKSERRRLIAEADKVFSIYIRNRRTINNIATCVTCGDEKHWRLMHNGHFISRRVLPVRWNEINCNVQCPNCNVNLGGNLSKYKTYIEQFYGSEAIDKLRTIISSSGKVSNDDIKEIISKYRKLVKYT